MNRRDFLFLRRTTRGRTLELSCRALYMRTLDAAAATQSDKSIFDHEPWMGEPPTDFERPADDWLRQIENQLQEVEILKLLDDEWLEPTGLGDQLEPVIRAFRSRGGQVEHVKT